MEELVARSRCPAHGGAQKSSLLCAPHADKRTLIVKMIKLIVRFLDDVWMGSPVDQPLAIVEHQSHPLLAPTFQYPLTPPRRRSPDNPGFPYVTLSLSAFGRIGIIAVAVALANLSISAVDYMLNAGILGNFTTAFDSLGLCVVNRRSPITSGANVSPAAIMGNGVNTVVFGHDLSPFPFKVVPATDGLTSA